MEFSCPGERIKKLRKKLNMKQQDFEDENITRSYFGMLEIGKRNLNQKIADIILKKMKKKAEELNIELELNIDYLMLSENEEAKEYCIGRLREDLNDNELQEIVEICHKYNLFDIEAITYRKIADQYYNQSDYSTAYFNYNLALDISKNMSLEHEQAYLYNRIGMCKYMELSYSESLLYFKRANHYAIKFKDNETELNSIYNLALASESNKLLKDALEYIDTYLSTINKNDNHENYIFAKIFKATCLEEQGELDEAINLCLNIADETSNCILLGNLYNNLGYLYYKADQFEKSLAYFNKSQELRMKYDHVRIAHTLIYKSELYIKNQLLNEAIMLISLAIDYAKEYNDKEYIVKGYFLLSNVYSIKEEYDLVEENYLKILEIVENSNDKDQLLRIYLKLLDIYTKRNDMENVKKFIDLSQKCIENCCIKCI